MMLLALVWTVCAWATSIDQVPNPRPQDSWVTDLANVLDDAATERLDDRLRALYVDLDVEVVVVTVDEVEGTPKQFATGLFNLWGIGDREANNGLLVLLVMGQRRLEMETGYGLEGVLPDGWLGSMQQQVMVPRFKEGDFAGGLERGLSGIDKKLRASPEEAREGTRGAIDVGQGGADGPDVVLMAAVGGGGLAVMVFGGVGLMVLRRRERTCPKCDLYMPKLDEVADDAHLNPQQLAEERVGSVDHQVHQCPQCGDVRAFERVRWFSGYSRCPKCRARTRTSQSRTVIHATQYSQGLVEITEDCASCSYHRRYERSTPRLPPPSSSSSSSSGGFSSSGGGGSFGGGSSGGGGAGSSW